MKIEQQVSAFRPRQPKIRFGPSGIHIFERASGINLLVDEIIPPLAKWAMVPRQVSIALTNACDLDCPYCFAPKTRATLPFDRVVSWLNELDANGTLGVGFGGGEPTLYRRFIDLCAYATNHTNLAVTFTTHGHHLEDAFLAALNGKVHFIRVSMDGIGATYERLRGRPFKSLEKRLDAIGKIMRFGINYVVNADTLNDIENAAIFAERVGASEFLLLPEQPVKGRAKLTDNTANALRAWVSQYAGGLRLAVSENGADGMPTCDPLPNETGLQAYAHIDANGVLKRTSFDCEGVDIGGGNILSALRQLKQLTEITK
jgi:MoaA/NifB/PqqE/SkfB family radical SAM enzyme